MAEMVTLGAGALATEVADAGGRGVVDTAEAGGIDVDNTVGSLAASGVRSDDPPQPLESKTMASAATSRNTDQSLSQMRASKAAS
jgi:hypothetical protein